MKFNLSVYIIPILTIGFLSCTDQRNSSLYSTENLQIEKLSQNTFRHISYLSTNDFGKVSCNGMIVIDDQEALIFDTPTNDHDSKELIEWVENSLKCKVIGVVVTHFHDDCLGGLNEFHARKIPSYASFKTIELAKLDSIQIPQIGFDNYMEISVGDQIVINEYFGEGHTMDNVISYYPHENVLFGGCLIKALGANKGYLGDANVDEWSNTVDAIKSKYHHAKVIIPGHGEPGTMDLLDYTTELFKKE